MIGNQHDLFSAPAPRPVVTTIRHSSDCPADCPCATISRPKSERAKKAGMDAAAQARAALLAQVREAMEKLAASRLTRCATADDAQVWLISQGKRSTDLGNAAGSIFLGSRWEHITFCESVRESNRGRFIRVWRLR